MHDLRITDEQVAEFDETGFLLIRSLFDADEMAALLRVAKSDAALTGESYVRKDADGGETRLSLRNELDDDSVYAAIMRSSAIVDTMARLLRDEVYHYHHKMMLKEPKVGGAWEWHQDYGYWYENGCLFPDMASCLIAVDRATPANGCLQVIRGSQKMGRVNHAQTGEQKGADMTRVEAALARMELVHCEMEPGDALFFHGNLLHRSDQNRSDDPRWSLIGAYNTRSNDPFITEGRHPNYTPLAVWPNERVSEFLLQPASAV